MVHEFHRFLPIQVFKHDDGKAVLLFQLPAYLGADPFLRPLDHLPEHMLAGAELKHLHVETADVLTAFAKAELDHSTNFTFPFRVLRPPAGKTFTRGECPINFIKGRFNSNSMQNIRHLRLSPYGWFKILMVENDCGCRGKSSSRQQ